ncbi:hypothetical protein FACS189413_13870 [Bacteroidia bacterium]|nr:hypothetical protein FACS189413_13870 [Bacteroidia bacterium]
MTIGLHEKKDLPRIFTENHKSLSSIFTEKVVTLPPIFTEKKMMDYFKRKIDYALLEWKNDRRHKPLMLRGARQIGKTSAVRNLGKTFKYYVELNFEDTGQKIKDLFQAGHSPKNICEKLSEVVDTPIIAVFARTGTRYVGKTH